MHPDIKALCKYIIGHPTADISLYRQEVTSYGSGKCLIYPDSIHAERGCVFFLAKHNGLKKLYIVELQAETDAAAFDGEIQAVAGRKVRIASLTHDNAAVLRQWFSFTNPVAFERKGLSIGLGDRLGIASPGHLRLVKKTNARPVLAQQSSRELNLTGRTFQEVLDAGSWSVLQEGYHQGFGADGDHLKTEAEVRLALDGGFSMITLDCSEKIDNKIAGMGREEIAGAYRLLPQTQRAQWESLYLGKAVKLDNADFTLDRDALEESVLVYSSAIDYIDYIYHNIIKTCQRQVDFEVSIDETLTPTTPQAHYFIAAELERRRVEVTSLAPRFCGEFQKAIDYIGDLAQFEREFAVHAAIADHFGYRLSIHSGSDKFSVYPVIGRYTKGRVHVKTAGTSWLEALRVIAQKKPDLFRRILAFATEYFAEATQYYHVTADLGKVPDVAKLPDTALDVVLEQNDGRQLLHITYGLVLLAKQENGTYRFRDEIYRVLDIYEDSHYEALAKHIGKHLSRLGPGM